jgi:tRNA-Thr(GGU) m(6)t(6)A37 methyltransferase TsaA
MMASPTGQTIQRSKKMSTIPNTFQLSSIGHVRRQEGKIFIEIDEQYRPALLGLEHFSHAMIFWWATFFDNPEGRAVLECDPPYAPDHHVGVFASSSPLRPNPVMMTTCKIIALDQAAGWLQVADLDAVNNTPVVDIKAYFPVCDRVQTAHIPHWLSDWPEWMPADGVGLMEGEEEFAVL